MKKQPALSVIIASGLLIISFQNCGKPMSFVGNSTLSLDKSGNVTTLPDGTHDTHPGAPVDPVSPANTGSTPVAGHSVPMVEPEQHSQPQATPVPGARPVARHEQCDNDESGHDQHFRCSSGVDDDLNDVSANDMSDHDRSKEKEDDDGSRKSVISAKTVDLSNLNKPSLREMYVRTANLLNATNVHSEVMSITAHVISSVSDVHSEDACMSADSIGSVSNVHSDRMKVVGRKNSSALATGKDFSNIHTDFLSISDLSIDAISDVHSRSIVVRGSKLANVSKIHGDIVLIDSHIENATDIKGTIFLRGSSTVTNPGGATVVHQ